MNYLYEGKHQKFSNFNTYDLDSYKQAFDAGYRYAAPEYKQNGGKDPGSGMPLYDTDLHAFETRDDAELYIDQHDLQQPYSRERANVIDLETKIADLERQEQEKQASIERDNARAAKRQEYNKNLPQWRKVRTQAIKAKNAYDHIVTQMNELKSEYDARMADLKQAMDDAGIQYSNIEDVLSKDFLK